MSIGKLALLAMTLFGLAIGVHEGIRLAGGLAVIILAQILLFAAAMAMLVSVARQDRARAAHDDARRARDDDTASTGSDAPQS
jgi:hypothetical protein